MREAGGGAGWRSHDLLGPGHGRHRVGRPTAAVLPRRLRRSGGRWRGRGSMIGRELLDDPRADPIAVGKELRDIARLNAWFGGTQAVVRELETFFERSRRETWTLLDLGTGLGDIPRAAARAARRHAITLRLIGVELNRAAARLARGRDGAVPLAAVLAQGRGPPHPPPIAALEGVGPGHPLHYLAPGLRFVASRD